MRKSPKSILYLSVFLGVLFSCGNVNPSSLSVTSSVASSEEKSEASSVSSMSSTSPNVSSSEPLSSEIPSKTDLVYNDYATFEKGSQSYRKDLWYRNDLTLYFADPFVLTVGDTYYLYGTTQRLSMGGFDCYESKDFQNWTLHEGIFLPSAGAWNSSDFFAPEVYRFGDTYYLYYSASGILPDGGNHHYFNVAVSSSPSGPFVEYQGKDAFGQTIDCKKNCLWSDPKEPGYVLLDQTLFADEDGTTYLYYSIYDGANTCQYIVGMALLDPVTVDWSTYKVLVRPGPQDLTDSSAPTLPWEVERGFNVAEGPCLVKSPLNGRYYLTYSINGYPDRNYSVCYASSDSPLGDYVKPYEKGQSWSNLLFGYSGSNYGTTFIQWNLFMSGTAHHSIFQSPDGEWWIVYHAHVNRSNVDNGRAVGFDHLYWDKETGTPYTHGPTYSYEPLPSQVTGYQNIAPLSSIRSLNIAEPEKLIDNKICEHYQLSQEVNQECVFPAGTSVIELTFPKKMQIGGISIYNSSQFKKYVQTIDYIDFGDNQVILNGSFPRYYVETGTIFVYPGSAFTYDWASPFLADKVRIGLSPTRQSALNEIMILGKEIV